VFCVIGPETISEHILNHSFQPACIGMPDCLQLSNNASKEILGGPGGRGVGTPRCARVATRTTAGADDVLTLSPSHSPRVRACTDGQACSDLNRIGGVGWRTTWHRAGAGRVGPRAGPSRAHRVGARTDPRGARPSEGKRGSRLSGCILRAAACVHVRSLVVHRTRKQGTRPPGTHTGRQMRLVQLHVGDCLLHVLRVPTAPRKVAGEALFDCRSHD